MKIFTLAVFTTASIILFSCKKEVKTNSDEIRAAMEAIIKKYPNVKVATRENIRTDVKNRLIENKSNSLKEFEEAIKKMSEIKFSIVSARNTKEAGSADKSIRKQNTALNYVGAWAWTKTAQVTFQLNSTPYYYPLYYSALFAYYADPLLGNLLKTITSVESVLSHSPSNTITENWGIFSHIYVYSYTPMGGIGVIANDGQTVDLSFNGIAEVTATHSFYDQVYDVYTVSTPMPTNILLFSSQFPNVTVY